MTSLVPDLIAIATAFLFGLGARAIGLPPMVGFLVAGFALFAAGVRQTPTLREFSQIGVTLLLFTIGLKLQIRGLLRPHVWGVASLHMALTIALAAAFLLALGATGLSVLAGLDGQTALLLGFALSFSSTVFAVKVLEERGEAVALYARIAVGVLIVQDIAAVVFLGVSAGKVPNVWALALLLLIPGRGVLHRTLERAGRGELQILYGLVLALGGAQIFEAAGVKGDLGALILGVLLAGHERASDLSRQLMAFKDLFLVGFFLGIGLSAPLGLQEVLIGALLMLLVPFKTALFFGLFAAFRLRARTAFLGALSLANYSEFGLIVVAVGVQQGMLAEFWLVVLAIAVALSFIVAAPVNAFANSLYVSSRQRLQALESRRRIPEEEEIEIGEAGILVFGMGRVGAGAYDAMRRFHGDAVLGVDVDEATVASQRASGRRVIRGSATDPDFWDRVHLDFRRVSLILLAMPNVEENCYAARQLRKLGFPGHIAATAKYDEELGRLRSAGADFVFNLYAEAGEGFAEDVHRQFQAVAASPSPR